MMRGGEHLRGRVWQLGIVGKREAQFDNGIRGNDYGWPHSPWAHSIT
jgi:hypothetical protein